VRWDSCENMKILKEREYEENMKKKMGE